MQINTKDDFFKCWINDSSEKENFTTLRITHIHWSRVSIYHTVQVPVLAVAMETANRIQEFDSTVVFKKEKKQKRKQYGTPIQTPSLYIIIQMLFSVFFFFIRSFYFLAIRSVFFVLFLMTWCSLTHAHLSHTLIHPRKKKNNNNMTETKDHFILIVNITMRTIGSFGYTDVNNR